MKRSLFRAAWVATLDDALGTIPQGAVIVEGNQISTVGSYRELSQQGPFDEELGSLESDLLIPGLTNAHHHSARYFRDGIRDEPLEFWLPFVLAFYRSDLSSEEVSLNSLWSGIELIRSGCTSVVDFHTGIGAQPRFGIPEVVGAYRALGLRVRLCPSVGDMNRLYYAGDKEVVDGLPADVKELVEPFQRPPDLDRFFDTWESLFDEFHEPGGQIGLFLGPVGAQWCSERLIRRVKETAQRCKTGVQIHLLETMYQRAVGKRTKGTSLVEWLDRLGFWGPEVSCAHAVWLSERDMDILRERDATVVFNPSSNLRLYSGIAPIRVMREHGVSIALGVDGFGFSDDNDIMADLRLGHFLQRLPGHSVAPILPEEWFKMAIGGGARVLQESHSLGSLSPTKKADCILVDVSRCRHPAAASEIHPLDLLLHRGIGSDVHTVIIGGRAIMREHKILTVDEASVATGIQKAMERQYPRLRTIEPLYRAVKEKVRDLYEDWDPDLPKDGPYRYNAC